MSRDDECWGCGDTSPDCACTKERAVSEWAEAQRLGYKQGAAEGTRARSPTSVSHLTN